MSMKKLMIAAAATLALGSASMSHAAGTILFDQSGAGGAGVQVSSFDWTPDNALAVGALSTAPAGDGTRTFNVVAQGKLGNFLAPGNVQIGVAAGEFTFQASFFEKATGIGTGTAGFALGAGASTFTIYYDASGNSNQLAGTGYGDGLAILTGTLMGLTGNFTDVDVLNSTACGTAGTGCGLLDNLDADNQNGTMTHRGNGSTTIQVDVNFANSNFFRSNITSLLIDLQDTTNNAIPFEQANPSDAVFGVIPVYSVVAGVGRVNGAACTTAGGQTEAGASVGRCDIHLQTDAVTSFNPTAVPEPGTLAIAGLALGALGLARRRRKS